MADQDTADEQKAAASQSAPAAKETLKNPLREGLTDEERRIQDALEDDDVRESLKELHAAKSGSGAGRAPR